MSEGTGRMSGHSRGVLHCVAVSIPWCVTVCCSVNRMVCCSVLQCHLNGVLQCVAVSRASMPARRKICDVLPGDD